MHYDFLNDLQSCPIIPTFNEKVFSVPKYRSSYRFPNFVHLLFNLLPLSEHEKIAAYKVIDMPNSDDYKPILNAFKCESAVFGRLFPLIANYAEKYISEKDFRKKLYDYLYDKDVYIPNEDRLKLRTLAIIPVYGTTPNSVEYISWRDDGIFVKKGAVTSATDYYVLNEKLLSKSDCEKIFDVNINEMNAQWERNRYNERLKRILKGSDIENIYRFLLDEYKSGALKKNDSFATLFADSGRVPLKNELGEIVDTGLFVCDQPAGYFPTKMIQRLIAHRECTDFARYLHRDELKVIHYEDVDYYEPLTADDIETLLDDYFINSEEILRGFYKDGLLPDELLREYNMEYMKFDSINESDSNYSFPSEPIVNRNQLIAHVRKSYMSKRKIISVRLERTVKKGQESDGRIFELRDEDTRKGAMRKYTPTGTTNRCYCQMCKKLMSNDLIEVNNLELDPEYYIPEFRVALCLNCSVHFKSLRANRYKRQIYFKNIQNAVIQNQGNITIQVDTNTTITFTDTHLAEIQEILKHMPD